MPDHGTTAAPAPAKGPAPAPAPSPVMKEESYSRRAVDRAMNTMQRGKSLGTGLAAKGKTVGFAASSKFLLSATNNTQQSPGVVV